MVRTITPIADGVPTVAHAASAPAPGAERAALEDRSVAELRAAIGRLRCLAAQRLAHHGVSLTHLHLLQLLEAHGELTMGRVAGVLDVSMSNATGLVDRMAERGLVERHRDIADRRVVHVHLTAAGRDVLVEMDAIRLGPLRAVLGRLDDDELRRLADAAADLHRSADEEVRLRLGPTSDSTGCPVAPSMTTTDASHRSNSAR